MKKLGEKKEKNILENHDSLLSNIYHLRQELDVYRVNPHGTSVGHQNHISQTRSSCGPHDSPSQTIEVVEQLLVGIDFLSASFNLAAALRQGFMSIAIADWPEWLAGDTVGGGPSLSYWNTAN